MARFMAGDLGGLDDMREALRRSLDLGLGYYTVNAYGNLAEQVWLTEGPAPALDLYRAGIEVGEHRGIVFKARWIEAESLWSLYDAGAWDQLVATTDSLVRWDDSYGGSQIGVIALSYKARVLMWRDEVAEAAAAAEQFLRVRERFEDPQVLVPALAIGALIASARGDAPTALALVEEFERTTRVEPRLPRQPARRRVAGLRIGRCDRARRRVARGCRRGRSAVPAQRTCRPGRSRPRAAGASKRPWVSMPRSRSARAEYGFVLGQGQALLGESRCLIGLGRAGEVSDKLATTRTLFGKLGARPLLADVDALIGRATMLSA